MAAHPDFEARMAATDASPGPAFARRLHYQASEGHDSWLALDRVKAPTLVLHGSNDAINPSANGVLLAERIPGAKLQLIDGARHSYFEEYRLVASQLVLDFLRRHPLQA
jgi:pimeloyl-ACP methyl ester carboxylesterase